MSPAEDVSLGPVVDGLRVITEGLAPDYNFIINGLMRGAAQAQGTPQHRQRSRVDRRPANRRQLSENRECASPTSSIDRPIFAAVRLDRSSSRWRGVHRAAACRPISEIAPACGEGQRSVSRASADVVAATVVLRLSSRSTASRT